jgi:ATP/maltotriose-dependent transcriptional regulator MalT
MNPHYLMIAYMALFRLYGMRGRPEEAFRYLDRLEATWPDMAFCTRGLRAVHCLRISPEDPVARAEAAAWCRDFLSSVDHDQRTPGMGPLGAAEAYYLAYLAWAQIQIALGDPQPALAYLQRQLARASASGLKNRIIELSLLQALGWRAEGDDVHAQEAIQRALSVAMPEGYVRSFDQGPALTQLLREASLRTEAAQQGIYREYVEGILSSTGSEGASSQLKGGRPVNGSTRTLYGERLSERELEVLHLIAQGATNREIAERLVITVGTVKSHVNHILGKLEAHNRTEAVARARDLGLIEI